jgi:prevent-host-death family protein
MPMILPISDLRNYTEVLNQVETNRPVYLTRNGRGRYVITKLDDYDRTATVEDLLKEIKKGERSIEQGKTSTIEQVASKLGISL